MIINRKRVPITVYKEKGRSSFCYVYHNDYFFRGDTGYYAGCFPLTDRCELPSSHADCSFDYLDGFYSLSFAKLPPFVQQDLTDYLADV